MAEHVARAAMQTQRLVGWLSPLVENATVLIEFIGKPQLIKQDETCQFDMPLPQGGPDHDKRLPSLLHVKIHTSGPGWGHALWIALQDGSLKRQAFLFSWQACPLRRCAETGPHGCPPPRISPDDFDEWIRKHCFVQLVIERTGSGWETRMLETQFPTRPYYW